MPLARSATRPKTAAIAVVPANAATAAAPWPQPRLSINQPLR